MAAKLYRMVYSTSSGFKCTRYFTRLQGDKATIGAKDVVESLMAESQARGATEIFARIQQFEADKGEFKPCAEDLLFNWPDTKEEPEVVTPPAKTVTAAAKEVAGKPANEPKLENKGKWSEQGIIYPVTGEPNKNGLVLLANGQHWSPATLCIDCGGHKGSTQWDYDPSRKGNLCIFCAEERKKQADAKAAAKVAKEETPAADVGADKVQYALLFCAVADKDDALEAMNLIDDDKEAEALAMMVKKYDLGTYTKTQETTFAPAEHWQKITHESTDCILRYSMEKNAILLEKILF